MNVDITLGNVLSVVAALGGAGVIWTQVTRWSARLETIVDAGFKAMHEKLEKLEAKDEKLEEDDDEIRKELQEVRRELTEVKTKVDAIEGKLARGSSGQHSSVR